MHTRGMTSFRAAAGSGPTLGPPPLTVMTLQVGLVTRSCEYGGATINMNKKLSFFSLLVYGAKVPISLWVAR